MECRSVLVVDEDKDIRDALQEAFKAQGYDVHTAINELEALDLLNNLSSNAFPGCIILDLAMPVMNGPEFLKHIETEYKNEFGDIPVITASANLIYADAAGFDQDSLKIKKEMNFDVLYKAIEHHCGNPFQRSCAI